MDEQPQVISAPTSTRNLGMLAMMLAMIIATLMAVAASAAVLLWLARSGRLSSSVVLPKMEPATPSTPPKAHLVALDPLLVNLVDGGGRSYLRIAMTLRVEDEVLPRGAKASNESAVKGKPVNVYEAAERDAALAVIGGESGVKLLEAGGKEHLKDDLRKALAQRVPEVKVADILFTEFLVQQ
jgi:flagellar FliL protein